MAPDETPQSTSNPRQWRITVTEHPDRALYSVAFEWRTFPCRSLEWDGRKATEFFSLGPRIASPGDVEAVLALSVDSDWWEGRKPAGAIPRRTARPQE